MTKVRIVLPGPVAFLIGSKKKLNRDNGAQEHDLAPPTACAKAIDACAKASASAHGGASFAKAMRSDRLTELQVFAKQ